MEMKTTQILKSNLTNSEATTDFPPKWRFRNKRRNSIQMIWEVPLIGWKIASTNQTPYPDLGIVTRHQYENFCARFSDVI